MKHISIKQFNFKKIYFYFQILILLVLISSWMLQDEHAKSVLRIVAYVMLALLFVMRIVILRSGRKQTVVAPVSYTREPSSSNINAERK